MAAASARGSSTISLRVPAPGGVDVLRLETGIHQAEAIGLYERVGFTRIAAFGPYVDDPLSRYYELRLG